MGVAWGWSLCLLLLPGGFPTGLPEATSPPLSPRSWEGSGAPLGQEHPPGVAGRRLQGALLVACLGHTLAARVSRKELGAAGLAPSYVTLQDPSCIARATRTHFLLEVPLVGCGAQWVPAPGGGHYENVVVLWGQGMWTTPGHLLEDEPEVLETIKISCPSVAPPLSPQAPPPSLQAPLPHLGQALLSLEVSSSPRFPAPSGPCTVPANARVYVQASLAAFDAALSFSLQLCALSPRSAAQPPGPHVLVRGGCAAEPGVVLAPPERAGPGLPPGCQERRRLSFRLRPRSNHSIQFLHCRLALCARRPRGRGLPQCPPPGGACGVSTEEAVEPGGGRGQRTITKPIIVTVGGPGPAPPAGQEGAEPDPSSAPWWRPVELQRPAPPRARPGPPPKAPAAARGLELPVVVAIAFSAFVIGVSLAGGVWLLHGRTGPAETPARSPLPAAQPAPGPRSTG